MAAESKRRLRLAFVVSAVGHGFVVALLALRPTPAPMVIPPAISIDLVARVPSAAPAASRSASKPAPATEKPAPAKAVPAPPPPQAKLLPKDAPDAMARSKPKPPPSAIQRRPRPKEMELGDAMAALRSELGESASVPMETEGPASTAEATEGEVAESGESGASGQGAMAVSPEVMKWMRATQRHVQSVWVNPPEFVGRGYVTELGVQLRADGTVVGRPEVRRSSGDPYADDNAVRALLKASPLPPPPAAGPQIFLFVPEATP